MPTAMTAQGDLLALDGMRRDEILAIVDQAEGYLPIAMGERPPLDLLRGRIIANLFFEDSTRTRSSFTIAARRLGAEVLDLSGVGSSITKGETLVDTARNIEAMGVSAIVVRCAASGGAKLVADAVQCPVINAGDGRHEHPTQGLLDLMTLQRRLGELEGRTVAIVGDISASRVARSAIHGLTALGADVLLVGPPALVPGTFRQIARGPGSIDISHDLDAVLGEVDAIMMLRVQFERGSDVAGDFRGSYGLTTDRLARLRADVPILHPGPINRGLEMDAEAADDPVRSAVLQQVTNGVATRMAVLARALGAS
jgi:aspartate carbamoyltransferase catalytic subunit